jgi:hypothetical protein
MKEDEEGNEVKRARKIYNACQLGRLEIVQSVCRRGLNTCSRKSRQNLDHLYLKATSNHALKRL